MDMNSILTIIGIIVLLGVAGGCAFAIVKVRGALALMDTKVDPMLDDLKLKTAALKPAAAQVEGIMQQVNVTLDALDLQVVEIDGKLDRLQGIAGTVAQVTETAPEALNSAKASVKSRLLRK